MNVAVILFGVVRSLHHCIDSIRRNIYEANTGSGVKLTVFASLCLIDTIDNPLNKEVQVRVDPAECLGLGADVYLLRTQREEDIEAAMAAARRQIDPWDNDWISTRNMLHQLTSLNAGWTTATQFGQRGFDAFLFARPDLQYLDAIPVAALVQQFRGAGNVLAPPWEAWGGINDRIALCDPFAARHYAQRIALVEEFSRSWPVHAESLLAYALTKAGCKIGELPVRARRVRANGQIVEEDFFRSRIALPATPVPARWSWSGVGIWPRRKRPVQAS